MVRTLKEATVEALSIAKAMLSEDCFCDCGTMVPIKCTLTAASVNKRIFKCHLCNTSYIRTVDWQEFMPPAIPMYIPPTPKKEEEFCYW